MLDPGGGGADGDNRYTRYEASTWVTSNPHHILLSLFTEEAREAQGYLFYRKTTEH